MHSKTGAGQIYSGKKTDSCVLPWQRSPHMRRANRFDAPAVTLHTLMKYGNYSHMKAPARARAGARVRKTTTNMTFSQKMHAVINSPVRKHIFCAAREPQKQRRPSADPMEGGEVRGVKGPLIGNPIVPVVQWERPLSAGGERLHPPEGRYFLPRASRKNKKLHSTNIFRVRVECLASPKWWKNW